MIREVADQNRCAVSDKKVIVILMYIKQCLKKSTWADRSGNNIQK